jgi:hypothetical protein
MKTSDINQLAHPMRAILTEAGQSANVRLPPEADMMNRAMAVVAVGCSANG